LDRDRVREVNYQHSITSTIPINSGTNPSTVEGFFITTQQKEKREVGTYYTVRQLAEALQMCDETVYKRIRDSGLEVVRIGRSIRIPESEAVKLLLPNTPQVEP
jgi:excisionase family DNA binding protein